MSSFVSRSLVLLAARLLNQGLLIMSPMLLVRLLTVAEYGRYRQFMAAAMLLISTASFSVASNLNYFVARTPELMARYVTNSCLMLAVTSGLAALAVIIGHPLLLPAQAAASWPWLALFIAAYLNFDLLQAFWLAQKQSRLVLYYSLGITTLRIGAVVTAAAVFHDARSVVLVMTAVETAKMLALFGFLGARGLLVAQVDRVALYEQVRFVVPFGVGSALYGLNDNVGKVLVSNLLSPEALAIYTIAAHQIPLIPIFNAAVTDVLFPDMVQRSRRDPRHGLRLWGRGAVVLFLLVCPSWVLMTYFAEPLIRALFTDAYASATPYFQILLLLLLRNCFSFSTALRSLAHNRPFILANTVGVALNLALTLALVPRLGLWAPTLGLLLSQYWGSFYLARRVLVVYQITLRELLDWSSLWRIALATAAAFAALLGCSSLVAQPLAGAVLGVGAFVLVYLGLLWRMRITEFVYLWDGLRRTLAPGARA